MHRTQIAGIGIIITQADAVYNPLIEFISETNSKAFQAVAPEGTSAKMNNGAGRSAGSQPCRLIV